MNFTIDELLHEAELSDNPLAQKLAKEIYEYTERRPFEEFLAAKEAEPEREKELEAVKDQLDDAFAMLSTYRNALGYGYRLVSEFSDEYFFADTQLTEYQEYAPDLEITAAYVLAAEGEYRELWVTEDTRYYRAAENSRYWRVL